MPGITPHTKTRHRPLGHSKIPSGPLTLSEQNIYGSSREGVIKQNKRLDTATIAATVIYNRIGDKQYQHANHLGNVLATVSDVPMADNGGSGSVTLRYKPDYLSGNAYSSFGAPLAETDWNWGTEYRYGFNGQEKDDEIYGDENSYSAEFWQYDPRLGRRWNVDPVFKYWESPYATFSNNPISFVDFNGANAVKNNKPNGGKDENLEKITGAYDAKQMTDLAASLFVTSEIIKRKDEEINSEKEKIKNLEFKMAKISAQITILDYFGGPGEINNKIVEGYNKEMALYEVELNELKGGLNKKIDERNEIAITYNLNLFQYTNALNKANYLVEFTAEGKPKLYPRNKTKSGSTYVAEIEFLYFGFGDQKNEESGHYVNLKAKKIIKRESLTYNFIDQLGPSAEDYLDFKKKSLIK